MAELQGVKDESVLGDVLEALATAHRDLERLEFLVVVLLRSNGATWEDVGDALGISRQAASKRFDKPKSRKAGSGE